MRAMSGGYALATFAVSLYTGAFGCERPTAVRQQSAAGATVPHDSMQNPTDLDALTSDAPVTRSIACPSIPAPKVDRTTDLRRECSLHGAHNLTNYCIIAAALHAEGFQWSREYFVDESDSRSPIRLSRYRAPKGSLILNPRVHGEVVVDAQYSEVHFYCTEVLQDRVRLVLHRIITP